MATDYITTREAAAAHKCNERRIRKLAGDGRILGAKQLTSGTWLIPKNFHVKPARKDRMGLQKLA